MASNGTEPRPAPHRSLFVLMKNDMVSYLNEYRCRRSSDDVGAALEGVLTAVAEHSVVLFEKPGCGFCRRAKELFSASYPDTTVHVMPGSTPPVRKALQAALAVRDVTFPCIFIQGVYVGGADEVSLLHQGGQLAGRIAGERVLFKVGQNTTKTSPSLCSQLAGAGVEDGICSSTSRWYLPQIKSYGNVVRGMSAAHVLLIILVLVLSESAVAAASEAGIVATLVIMAVFGVDLALYILLGATPISLVGNVVTLAVWDFRGPAVPNIPYKVVFVVYVLALVNILRTCGPGEVPVAANSTMVAGVGNSTMSTAAGNGTAVPTALGCWKNHSTEYRATLIGAIVNSGALAVFRF